MQRCPTKHCMIGVTAASIFIHHKHTTEHGRHWGEGGGVTVQEGSCTKSIQLSINAPTSDGDISGDPGLGGASGGGSAAPVSIAALPFTTSAISAYNNILAYNNISATYDMAYQLGRPKKGCAVHGC